MGRLEVKREQALRRKSKVRSRLNGTAQRPRLTVRVTNRHVIAQLVDDTASKTLVYVSTQGGKDDNTNLTDKAAKVGEQLAEAAKKLKIKQATLDRGSKLYHGRVKVLTEKAREKGLEI